jgi:predicted RNA polymerase sigma factor
MRLGRIEEARVAFDAARRLTTNEVELEFLAQRLVQLDSESG